MRLLAFVLAAFIGSGSIIHAAEPIAAPLPPVLAWKGASLKLMAKAHDPWISPGEESGLARSPDYARTRAFAEKMVAQSPLLSLEVFGKTSEGREMIALRAHKSTLAPDSSPKPVILVQAGIHAGEIDGKDAGLMLLRDIAFRGKQSLLDHVDIVFVPIFNIDGHERASAFNRPNQRGPLIQGWRTNAQNLNLNRDYLKADTPEMQAMIGLIRKYQPVLYLDLHVTDGTDHQYDIAFAFAGWEGLYAQSPQIGQWLDQRLRPAVSAALKKAGHQPGYYVSALDERDPEKGIVQDPDQPRFSTGYGDLAHIPTVLVETHSLKPFRQRVLGTYVLVEAAVKLVGQDARRLAEAIASDRASRPTHLPLRWKMLDAPIRTEKFLGIAHETYLSPASGRHEIRWLGRPVTLNMPVFGFAPELTAKLPVAWWVPPSADRVIERMRLHGIVMEEIAAPRQITLDRVRLVDPKLASANEGHVPLSAADYVHETQAVIMPAGSVRVPSDQPLGLLAAAMLEAESPDSFLAWNFFPGILQRTEYIEGYVVAPMADAMLASDPALKAQFEAKLAQDPVFAANAEARLQWFYSRSPYYDASFLLYPVGREVAP